MPNNCGKLRHIARVCKDYQRGKNTGSNGRTRKMHLLKQTQTARTAQLVTGLRKVPEIHKVGSRGPYKNLVARLAVNI